MAERIAFGYLKIDESKFWHVSLNRLVRAFEWSLHEVEQQERLTRTLA